MHSEHQGKITLRRLMLLTTAVAVATVGWFFLGNTETAIAAEGSGAKVLATVGGEAITESEILEAAKGQLLGLERQRHDLIEQLVRNEVQQRLIEAEAKKRGLTSDSLMQEEVQGKLDKVPQEKVDEFYNSRGIRAPKEQIEPRIREFLRQQEFMEALESTAKVEFMIEPFRVEVEAKGPAKGPDQAPIEIVEFSDFQCPFCSRVNPTLAKVQETYGDKVRIVFRQYPLPMHAEAKKAGEASLCADDQGQFWAMHDAMFADQQGLKVEQLKEKAAAIEGVDTAAFDECLDSGKYAAAVELDLKEGAEAGVSGTPAFFINGRFLSGAVPFEQFSEVIDAELKRVGAAG